MASLHAPSSERYRAQRVFVVLLAAVIYLVLPLAHEPTRSLSSHFVRLAEAFRRGRLEIEASGPDARVDELIPSGQDGRYYCPYPPLPAVLLLPFVAIFGSAVKVGLACRVVSVLNVLLFDLVLGRLPARLDMPVPRTGPRLALNLLFAFGTPAWHNAHLGADWHLAQAVALAAVLLAMHEFLGRNRAWLIGCWVAATLLTRPTACFAALFFLAPLLRSRAIGKLLQLLIGPCFAALLLGVYNFARFGDPLTFGYDRILLRGEGLRLMREYGQFNAVFIPRNLFWFFLAPPWPRHGFPWLGYDPRGLSLFVVCPPAIYAFAALRRRGAIPMVRAAGLGIVACLLPLLMYFNTGYWQFGPRFAMDFLPLLMLLIVAGIGSQRRPFAYALVVMALVIQIWGVVLDPVSHIPV